MKTTSLFFLSALILVLSAFKLAGNGAEKYITKNGHIEFYSETPMETIEANSESVLAAIDAATGAIQFKVSMMSFQFEKKLMQEHFNENYMESSKFPYATFSGTILNIKDIDFTTNDQHTVNVKGDLKMHGVSRNISVTGTLTVIDDEILLHSVFDVKPADYDIKIPGAVKGKIAESLRVTVNTKLQTLQQS